MNRFLRGMSISRKLMAVLVLTSALHSQAALDFGDRKPVAQTLTVLRVDPSVLAASVQRIANPMPQGAVGSSRVRPD